MTIATLRKLEQLYKRIHKPIEDLAFPLILLLWPLNKITQGIDVTDSTYSLGNYLFADRLKGTWVMATYLSNFFGSLFVKLPGGDTLLGMNIYTGLVISLTALIVYYGLRKDFTAPVLFLGEFISISFCWIPSGILYNYLTYLFLSLAAILLYYGVKEMKILNFYFAGMILGFNVFVRIPNVVEMMLILVVLICVPMALKQINEANWKRGNELMAIIGACIVGYVIGMSIPMAMMATVYGGNTFARMFAGLMALSESNSEYTAGSMLYRTFAAYLHSLKWTGIIVAVIFAGTLMMAVLKSHTVLKWIGRTIYTAVLALMLRFMWGRGMFSFRYYEDYTSMYEWGMILIMISWVCVFTVLIKRNYNLLIKTYATIVMVILIITPMGSNNYTMQNINNLFLVVPFTLYVTGGWLYKGVHRIRLQNVLYGCNFPWMSMVLLIFAVILVQSIGFHTGFVFKDGMDGTPRDSSIVKNAATESVGGIYTTGQNARIITELCDYVYGDKSIKSMVYWGNCPGLAYILRIPSEIGTTWPDLDSYPVEDLEAELKLITDRQAKGRTALVWREYSEYSGMNTKYKEDMVKEFIELNHMRVVFENEEYRIYK